MTFQFLKLKFKLNFKAAAIIGGVSDCYIRPGSKVLYLGGASGTTVSHVSDIVGPVIIFILFNFQEGIVYAVEFSARSGRDLVNMAKKRINVIPLIADARKPLGNYFYKRIQNACFNG